VVQGSTGLGERAAGRAGIGDLLEQRRTGFRLVDAQALGLREKKPAGSGRSNLPARPTGLHRPAFAGYAGWWRPRTVAGDIPGNSDTAGGTGRRPRPAEQEPS